MYFALIVITAISMVLNSFRTVGKDVLLISSTAICLILIICGNYRLGWDPKLDTEPGKMPMFCELKEFLRKKKFFKTLKLWMKELV